MYLNNPQKKTALDDRFFFKTFEIFYIFIKFKSTGMVSAGLTYKENSWEIPGKSEETHFHCFLIKTLN